VVKVKRCHDGIPTSVVLEELFRDAPLDYVTIAWLIGSLHKRSFGLVMLLIALVGLVPRVSVFIGILLGFPGLQMILGQESPSLPHFIAPHPDAENRLLKPLREYRDSLEELAHLLQRCAR
jgi:hypothetical protein